MFKWKVAAALMGHAITEGRCILEQVVLNTEGQTAAYFAKQFSQSQAGTCLLAKYMFS